MQPSYLNRVIIIFLLATLCFTQLSAQNWQCIKTDGEYIYGILSSGDKTIRIDSVYHSSGFTYYINPPTIRWTSECQNPFGFSFLGKKIFSDNEGFYHFININNDTLHVKSNALVNENWIFYSNEVENLRIWATIDSIASEPFSRTVYPNPVDETLTFDLKNLSLQNLSIQIYGSDATQLMDIPVTNQIELVNTKQLKPGIYFYRVNNDLIKGSGKFIKN